MVADAAGAARIKTLHRDQTYSIPPTARFLQQVPERPRNVPSPSLFPDVLAPSGTTSQTVFVALQNMFMIVRPRRLAGTAIAVTADSNSSSVALFGASEAAANPLAYASRSLASPRIDGVSTLPIICIDAQDAPARTRHPALFCRSRASRHEMGFSAIVTSRNPGKPRFAACRVRGPRIRIGSPWTLQPEPRRRWVYRLHVYRTTRKKFW